MSTDFLAGILFGLGVVGSLDKEHSTLGALIGVGILILILPRIINYLAEKCS